MLLVTVLVLFLIFGCTNEKEKKIVELTKKVEELIMKERNQEISLQSTAQNTTLALQAKCADGALKYYNEAIVPFLKSKENVSISYHYNKKLDICLLRVVHFAKNHFEEIINVNENKVIAGFVQSQGIWIIEDKIFTFDKSEYSFALNKFNASIKPYMEE